MGLFKKVSGSIDPKDKENLRGMLKRYLFNKLSKKLKLNTPEHTNIRETPFRTVEDLNRGQRD